MIGFGVMILFEVEIFECVKVVFDGFEVFSFVESFGGVELLVCYFGLMMYVLVLEECCKEFGIGDGFV